MTRLPLSKKVRKEHITTALGMIIGVSIAINYSLENKYSTKIVGIITGIVITVGSPILMLPKSKNYEN